MTGKRDEGVNWRDPTALLTEHDLTIRWRRSIRTLQRWRAERYGPAYLRIGGCVLYRVADILDYEARMQRGGGSRP